MCGCGIPKHARLVFATEQMWVKVFQNCGSDQSFFIIEQWNCSYNTLRNICFTKPVHWSWQLLREWPRTWPKWTGGFPPPVSSVSPPLSKSVVSMSAMCNNMFDFWTQCAQCVTMLDASNMYNSTWNVASYCHMCPLEASELLMRIVISGTGHHYSPQVRRNILTPSCFPYH